MQSIPMYYVEMSGLVRALASLLPGIIPPTNIGLETVRDLR
jgi:hypothetical protein